MAGPASQETHERKMEAAVVEVFATMVRRSCRRVFGMERPRAEAWARVELLQDCRGACEVRMELASADLLVELLTGVKDERLRADVVGELCNMLCAGWMNRTVPRGSGLAMSVPRTGVGALLHPLQWSVEAVYQFDGRTFSVHLAV